MKQKQRKTKLMDVPPEKKRATVYNISPSQPKKINHRSIPALVELNVQTKNQIESATSKTQEITTSSISTDYPGRQETEALPIAKPEPFCSHTLKDFGQQNKNIEKQSVDVSSMNLLAEIKTSAIESQSKGICFSNQTEDDPFKEDYHTCSTFVEFLQEIERQEAQIEIDDIFSRKRARE